jgi:hypothetical protein
MLNYQSDHGRLPPAVVYGEDGRLLYSWRVLILPYMEQRELYEQFHLDEAWDSPHNRKLLERMPASYAPPPGKQALVPAYHTVYHVFVGKGAAFEDNKELKSADDFPDGTSNTILIVEAGTPTPWTKPEDIPFDPDAPLTIPRPLFRNVIRIALVDGSIHHIRKDISATTLRAAITRNGGDRLGEDWRGR